MTALERANEVRLARSAVKHALRDGAMSVEEALEHPAVQTLEIGRLLEAQRRWGPARVASLLRYLRDGVSPPVIASRLRRVENFSERERAAIVRACKETKR
jgi:hypothetical protein